MISTYRVRVVDPLKFILSSLLFLILISGMVLLLTDSALADDVASAEITTYRVFPGDTLWAIAADISPPTVDLRDTVKLIRTANDLDGVIIYPGQELIIPVYPTPSME